MSEITLAKYRDINIITAEIRTIQDSVRRTALEGAMEIGRRLIEAKEMLPHGEWGSWLKEEFEFSQPTASRLMTLFREYGADQASLFGAESKYSTLNTLSISKALRLIAIPSDEREEWAEEHDVENLSTRELDRLIKEKEAAEQARAEAERERAETAELLDKKSDEYAALTTVAKEYRDQAANADSKIAEARKDFENEKSALERKLNKAWEARKKAEELQRQAENKAAEETGKVKAELEALRKNPDIPPELIEKAAEQKAAAIRKEAERAKAELEEARKALALSCPEAAVFAAYFDQVQRDFGKMLEALDKVRQSHPDTGIKLTKAASAVLTQLKERVGNGNE